MPRALITGITGQDGLYLSELLLREGYEVYGLIRGQNNPKADLVAREAPVPLCIKVAQYQVVLQAQTDACHRSGDLASDELRSASRAFVVEQDAG